MPAGTATWAAARTRSRARSLRWRPESWNRARLKPTRPSIRWAPPMTVMRLACVATIRKIAAARSATDVSTCPLRHRPGRDGGRCAGARVSSEQDRSGQSEGSGPDSSPSRTDTSTYDSESPRRSTKLSSTVASGRPRSSASRSRTSAASGAASTVPCRADRSTTAAWRVQRGVVGLAGGGGREGRDDEAREAGGRHTAEHRHAVEGREVQVSGHEEHELAVVLDRACLDTPLGGDPLDTVEVDPQSEDLREPAVPADQLEDAVLVLPGEVARAQLVHDTTRRKVPGTGGVAEHHVGSGVDELADAVPCVRRPGVDAE